MIFLLFSIFSIFMNYIATGKREKHLAMLAQLGCKLAKLAPSWRLPDRKKQKKTNGFSTFFKIPFLALSGPKLGPCWLNLAQVSSKLAHLGSKLAPSWPKIAQVGSKLAPSWVQVGSMLAQDGPSWLQVGPSWLQVWVHRGPRMLQKWVQEGSWWAQEPRLAPRVALGAQNCFK